MDKHIWASRAWPKRRHRAVKAGEPSAQDVCSRLNDQNGEPSLATQTEQTSSLLVG